jgi:uncharacterized membrane protein YeaQ/YmgE (transglycosylase-associated protein family)
MKMRVWLFFFVFVGYSGAVVASELAQKLGTTSLQVLSLQSIETICGSATLFWNELAIKSERESSKVTQLQVFAPIQLHSLVTSLIFHYCISIARLIISHALFASSLALHRYAVCG